MLLECLPHHLEVLMAHHWEVLKAVKERSMIRNQDQYQDKRQTTYLQQKMMQLKVIPHHWEARMARLMEVEMAANNRRQDV